MRNGTMDKDEIKRLRKDGDMTQQEFADLIGVSWGTVNRWEAGAVRPSKLSLRRLAQVAKNAARAGVS